MYMTCDALSTWLVVSVSLVRGGVQEHDGEYVEVPHAVDACEEGAVHLHGVSPPVPVTLIHLDKDGRASTKITFLPTAPKTEKRNYSQKKKRGGFSETHLTDDEEDDSHGSTSQRDQHEKFEPENQTLEDIRSH